MQRALAGTRGIAANAGRDAGMSFGSEFQKAFGESMRGVNDQLSKVAKGASKNVEDNFKPELARIMEPEFAKIEKAADSSGDKSSKNYSNRFKSGLSGIGDAFNSIFDRADKDADRAGTRAGHSFSDRFSTVINSSVGKSAKAAANSFAMLYGRLAATGTAVSGLVGGISALVSGLFLLGTAAASASASLVAVGGLLGSLLQGAIATGIAFKGVFGAISAGMKNVKADTGAGAAATLASARRIADARARITDVQIRNAERLADAAENVADAERTLTRAQQNSLNAQQKLNEARDQAAKDLDDLGYAVEEAGLNERRALLRLQEARAEAAKVADAPPSQGRDEILLSLEEAEFAAKMATKSLLDLTAEQDAATAAGVEGSDIVVDAKNEVIDANNAIAEAEAELAKARQDAAATASDADRDLAKARLDLTRATQDASAAQSAASSEASKYSDALNKLSPSAQTFVEYMVSMKDEFNAFKKAVQEPFFDAFNKPFREMVETLLPVAQAGLAETARIMGELGGQFAGALVDNTNAFAAALDFNNSILDKFNQTTETGKSTIGNLVDLLFRLLEAIKPVTDRFADWVVTLIEGWAVMTDTGEEMEKLTGFFDRAGDRAAAFGDIFGSIFSAIGSAATAAGPAIEKLLTFLSDSFAGIADTAKNNQGPLQQFFLGVEKNIEPLLELMGQLVLVFAGLGADPNLGKSFEILKGVVEPLKTILGEGSNAGPAFAKLVVTIVELIAAFAKTDAIKVFFEVLNSIATVAKNFFESDFGQALITTLAPALAAFKAFSLVFLGLQFVANIFLGSILKLIQPIMSLWTGFQALALATGGVGAAFTTVILPIAAIIGVIVGLVAAFKHLWDTNETFRDSVRELIGVLKELWDNIVAALVPAIENMGEKFMELWEAIRPVFEKILEKVIPILTNLAEYLSVAIPIAIKILQTAFDIAIGAIIWLLDNVLEPVFTTVFGTIGNILGIFTGVIAAAFKWIKQMWDDHGAGAMKTIGDAWNTFLGFFSGPNNIFTKINKAWNDFWSGLWTSVSDKWDSVSSSVSNALGNVKTFFTDLRDDIGEIWDGVWDGMLDGATKGVNRLINGLNRLFVRPLNKLTEAFGLTIPEIPIIGKADGGYISGPGGPRDDKIPARLSNGEYVVKASSVRKFGRGTFDALNNGRMPTGGLQDWVSDKIEGASSIIGSIVDVIKDGPKAAVKYLFENALKPLTDNLGEGLFPQLLGGILNKLMGYITRWGDKKQAAQDKERAEEEAAGASVSPYTGAPGGWTYPLAKRFRSYTFSGHSPSYAYDIGAPSGIGVRAVSAGKVISSVNKGNTSYGQYLRISHADGTTSLYAHLSKRIAGVGDIVKTGDLIGLSGYSGGVRPPGPRGAHLHFELGSSDARAMMLRRGVKLASGGTVMSTPGGVLALLAEGGRHERVEPLNSSGLSRRDMALINAVAMRIAAVTNNDQGDQGVTVKVYIGDEELRDIVKYEIQDNQTGLARDLSIGRRRY